VFEKYDGLRAFWNPDTRTFYSRHGNAFNIPSFIVDSMPADIFLDGEIWFALYHVATPLSLSLINSVWLGLAAINFRRH